MTPESTLTEALAPVPLALEELARSFERIEQEASQTGRVQLVRRVPAPERWSLTDAGFTLLEVGSPEERALAADEQREALERALARVPEPPADVHPALDRRMTAGEVRTVELGKLIVRLEHRCDAQIGRIVELEGALVNAERSLEALSARFSAAVDSSRTHVQRLEAAEAALAHVSNPLTPRGDPLDRVGAELELHRRIKALEEALERRFPSDPDAAARRRHALEQAGYGEIVGPGEASSC